jgi:hypothetical protein
MVGTMQCTGLGERTGLYGWFYNGGSTASRQAKVMDGRARVQVEGWLAPTGLARTLPHQHRYTHVLYTAKADLVVEMRLADVSVVNDVQTMAFLEMRDIPPH